MADGLKQSDWTLGSLDRKMIGENLFVGTSIFDRTETYVRIDADAERLVVIYHVGPAPDRLQPRNMARILPGEQLGREAQSCLVSLLAWRSEFMDDERWKRLCVSFETEMFIIKSRLEAREAC